MKNITNFIFERSLRTWEYISDDLYEWWNNTAINKDNYKDSKEFQDIMKEAADRHKKGHRLLDMCISALKNEYDYDNVNEIHKYIDDIKDFLTEYASLELDD